MRGFLGTMAAVAAMTVSASVWAAPRVGAAGPAMGRDISSAYGAVRPAPKSFEARYEGAWWQRRGGPTGDFFRVFGEGVAFDPAAAHDELVAVSSVERFFADNQDLLPPGVVAADLVLRTTIAWKGRRIVSFEQTIDGVPVEGASAYAVLVGDRLVLFGARLFPVSPVETEAAIGAADAERVARAALSGLRGAAEASGTRRVVLPLAREDGFELRAAFSVPLRLDGRGKWTAYVDARSGALIALRDERTTMSGAVAIEHHDRNPGGDLIAGPAAFLDLLVNGSDVTTDADGLFETAGDAADIEAELSGPHVDVQTMTGDDVALSAAGLADGETALWTSDASEIQQAQLDVYSFAVAVTEHARSLQDDVPWLQQALVVRPNQPNFEGETGTAYCNAWSDGETINFLMAGSSGSYQCNNAAMVSDIAFHEYGHCLHIQNEMLGAGVFDGSASEAFADTMSVSMTHDNIIGPYFEVGGAGIRDVEPDMVWPDDYTDDENYVHYNGLILGGALWDLRKLLVEQLGDADGNRATDEIYASMLRLTEDIPSSFEAALASDDDDGDLANGTPHACALYDSFEPHGLVQGGLGRIVIDHEPTAVSLQPGVPIEIAAGISVPQEECSTLGGVKVIYSTDGGASWAEAAMTETSPDAYAAELPALAAGSELRYRIEAEEVESGQWISRPTNPAEPYYIAYVGPLAEILCDGFEGADDGGWTHELLAGDEAEGADDWQRGTPTGAGGDPEGAFEGASAWGNDLAILDNWNGQYQADKTNTLRSPTYDLSGYGTVRLALRRWLNVEDGYFDRARIYVNDQEVWSNAISEGDDTASHALHHADSEWIPFSIDITPWAAGQAAVEVRFEIQSDQGLQLGGWTIDDFCLYTADVAPEVDAGTDAGEADGGDTDAGPGITDVKAGASGCDCQAAGGIGALSLLGAIF